MTFSITDDKVLYLYPYYSLNEKQDEMSKKVYQVFKKDWNTHFNDIRNDLFDAVRAHFEQNIIKKNKIAVAIMPSHSKDAYGQKLLNLASDLCKQFGFQNATHLIRRTMDKTKSTEGGERTVWAHLKTLGLGYEINKNVNVYIVLDDITTTGSSLEAAKELLINNGVEARNIIKIAIAKTMHDDGLLFG